MKYFCQAPHHTPILVDFGAIFADFEAPDAPDEKVGFGKIFL